LVAHVVSSDELDATIVIGRLATAHLEQNVAGRDH
jgi:hypothetical protein